MSVAKKDRFVLTNLKVEIGRVEVFPPPILIYEGKKLYNLGVSNKNDLVPVNIDTAELQRAVTFGDMKQIICTSDNGDLFDVCLYQNESGECFVYGIRTRQLPDSD